MIPPGPMSADMCGSRVEDRSVAATGTMIVDEISLAYHRTIQTCESSSYMNLWLLVKFACIFLKRPF